MFNGHDYPSWSSEHAAEGREYIATSLLNNKCAPARDLTVVSAALSCGTTHSSSSATHGTQTVNQSTTDFSYQALTVEDYLYYPRDDELEGDFPVYNMLHDDYIYLPSSYYPLPQVRPNNPDLTRRQLSNHDTRFLDRWCRDTPESTILHQDHQHGIVQAIDVMQLLCPTSLSIGVLSYILGESFPSDHESVVIIRQLTSGEIWVIWPYLW